MSIRRHIFLLEDGNDVLTNQRIFLIKDKHFSIGRATSNDIVVNKDYLSREHALFRMNRHGQVELIDGSFQQRSRNGTFVNGESISRQVLSHGDFIELSGLMSGIYLSPLLEELELFHYLEAISKYSSFDDDSISHIVRLEKVEVKSDFTIATQFNR